MGKIKKIIIVINFTLGFSVNDKSSDNDMGCLFNTCCSEMVTKRLGVCVHCVGERMNIYERVWSQ